MPPRPAPRPRPRPGAGSAGGGGGRYSNDDRSGSSAGRSARRFGGGDSRGAGGGRSAGPARRAGRYADDAADRPKPAPTAAQRRSAEIKAKRPRRDEPEQTPSERRRAEQSKRDQELSEREKWVPERWQEAESIRDVASEATTRARTTAEPTGRRRANDPARLDPQWVESVQRESTRDMSARYMERLAAATEALERDRYRDALRMVSTVLKNLPNVGGAHEVAGIAHYRLGEWRKAINELQQARDLHPSPEQLPVLADCFRALRRYRDVEEIWREIRESSPAPHVMAEGRIVAAGALADQGDLRGALALMLKAADAPKRVREHHLKQWYVIGDLYDRSGDVIRARNFFQRIAAVDPQYADVRDRLAGLGGRR